MAKDYNSPITVFEERAPERQQGLTNDVLRIGAILPSNDGSALSNIELTTENDLLKQFGIPDEYNYMYHKQITDALGANTPCHIIRPIATNAKNASLALKSNSGTKTNVARKLKLKKTSSKFYNEQVAEVSLNYDYVAEKKIEFIRKYVSSKKNIAVAVCSDIEHLNYPIFSSEIQVIRDYDVYKIGTKFADFEAYGVKPKTITPKSNTYATLTGLLTLKFDGDLTSDLKVENVVKVYSTEANRTSVIQTISYSSTLNETTITTYWQGEQSYSELTTVSIKYLSGDALNYKFINERMVVGVLGGGKTFTVFGNIDADLAGKSATVDTFTYTIVSNNYSSSTKMTTIVIEEDLDNTIGADSVFKCATYGFFTEATISNLVFVEYNENTWKKLSIADNSKVYVELRGAVYLKNANTLTKLDEVYVPIDTNFDGKANKAIPKIYSSTLLKSNGDLVSFSDLYNRPIDFVNGDVIVIVVKKNDTTGLWDYAETLVGNYNQNSKDLQNKSNYIENVVYTNSKLIYAKVKETEYTNIAITGSPKYFTMTVADSDSEFLYVNAGDKIVVRNFTDSTVAVTERTFKVTDFEIDSLICKIWVEESLTNLAVSGETVISNILCEQVSTNKNYYADINSPNYDSTNTKFAVGYSVDELTVYDYAPIDGEGNAITTYSIVANDDLNSSADEFADKDNYNVSILLGYETVEDNIRTANRMAEIAINREDCQAIITTWDITLFDFTNKEVTALNLVDNYGNQRSSKFTGNLTKYSTYIRVDGNMKYDFDKYTNKYRWYPIAGDIARKIAENDTTALRGAEYPIAGVNGGEMQNQIKFAFIPNFEQRELLNKNGINTIYQGSSSNNVPVIFSNLTNYDLDVPVWKTASYRILINQLKKFISNSLFTKYFKYKNDRLKNSLESAFYSYIAQYIRRGSVYSAEWIYPEVQDDNAKRLTIQINLVINPALEQFKVILNMTETGVAFTEVY